MSFSSPAAFFFFFHFYEVVSVSGVPQKHIHGPSQPGYFTRWQSWVNDDQAQLEWLLTRLRGIIIEGEGVLKRYEFFPHGPL